SAVRSSVRDGCTAWRGACVPRRAHASSFLRPKGAVVDGERRRILAQDGGARLDRHDMAEEIWRPRAELSRTLCRDGGNAGGRRAGERALDCRPAIGPTPAALWHGGAAADPVAAHRQGRMLL